MTQRPRSATRDRHSLSLLSTTNSDPPTILPLHTSPSPSRRSWRDHLCSPRSLLNRPRTRSSLHLSLLILSLLLIVFFNSHTLGTIRRDFIYLIRPIWDAPPPPWTIISHFPPPRSSSGRVDIDAWCGLHGWTSRQTKPTVVDAILLSTELDMLEIRMREYLPHVDIFVIVESDKTFAGQPKPTHFLDHRQRFADILQGTSSRLVYHKVEGLLPDRPSGSFENELTMRKAVGKVLTDLNLASGSLVIQSDVDEIISRETLDLLASCRGFDRTLHLNVVNYLYGFNFPIPGEGYWRPHVDTTNGGLIPYHHSRGSDELLDGAGWHCTFCFPTLDEMKVKMVGYSHNDRVRDHRLLDMSKLRGRVCNGEDPFGMYPVSQSPTHHISIHTGTRWRGYVACVDRVD